MPTRACLPTCIMIVIEMASTGTKPRHASATVQQAKKAIPTPMSSAHAEPIDEPSWRPVIAETSCVCFASAEVSAADVFSGSSKKPIYTPCRATRDDDAARSTHRAVGQSEDLSRSP